MNAKRSAAMAAASLVLGVLSVASNAESDGRDQRGRHPPGRS
jgi:hypothetical protein